MLEDKSIALIGAGVMAEVIALGLLRSKLTSPEDLVLSHYRPERLRELRELGPVHRTGSNTEAYDGADIAVLCVRPQAMKAVLAQIRGRLDARKLLISIAAGLPIEFYERQLGQPVPFIRAMPTFFGRIKAGTTGLALNSMITAEQLALATRLFGTVSESVNVLPEDEMDAFTTFGSTTTATVYLLLDALITAGSLVGLRHQASHARRSSRSSPPPGTLCPPRSGRPSCSMRFARRAASPSRASKCWRSEPSAARSSMACSQLLSAPAISAGPRAPRNGGGFAGSERYEPIGYRRAHRESRTGAERASPLLSGPG